MVPSPLQNTVGVCSQITLLILYYISSRLATLLKIIDAPIQVSYIYGLTVSCKFINFNFQIFLLLSLKCLLASRLKWYKLSTLLRFGSCNHWILACFLCSKKPKHSSSNLGLCCFNSYKPRLSLAEILMYSLNFFQALFMSSRPLKFSKAAKLFEILIRYCFLTPSSFSCQSLTL